MDCYILYFSLVWGKSFVFLEFFSENFNFNRIQVRINDREVLATILDDERSIGGDRWTMLLGGVPSRLESLIQEAEVGTVESLVGCLSDFQLDYE